MTWDSIRENTRVEMGLVQVDIAGHSKLAGSDRTLSEAKSIFQKQMEAIANSRGGRRFNWAGDGGSFMFLTADGEGFNDLVFSAMQMLYNMPAINEEIATRTDLETPFDVRISCDAEVVTYATDPGRITGDFVNRFIKSERAIGLTNSVQITHRVWRQLKSALRSRFVTFMYSPDVESQIYSYGGKERQLDVLRSLHNVDQRGRAEQPAEEACVEIVAFEGDTLASLSKEAYGDVTVEGFENVGGINLLITKNADICQRHVEETPREGSYPWLEGISREQRAHLESLLSQHSAAQRNRFLSYVSQLPCHERDRIIDQVICGDERVVRSIMDMLEWRSSSSSQPGRPPQESFRGGESLRFYNCTALGYVPHVGDGTLLDNVFAGNLIIKRVVGGVTEPVIKQRIFEFRDDAYHEIEELDEESQENQGHP